MKDTDISEIHNAIALCRYKNSAKKRIEFFRLFLLCKNVLDASRPYPPREPEEHAAQRALAPGKSGY
ncbi:MAG: hypothetical protein IJO35_06195, partial [Methanocorpusculum sp.]|nr:hypothetical protein [Methanocorpusculum sp.]